MRVYYDADADLSAIQYKKVVVVGYGSQGHAHALNLRDAGVKELRIALKADSNSIGKAKTEKFEVMTVVEAAKWADVMMVLTPDETQAELYTNEIAPHIKQGASLVFGHGFNVHFGMIEPRADLDVWMVAPKDVGPQVRAEYQKGSGVPCLVAVHQDASGNAWELALAYAAAIGGGRIGIFETTFREECEVDLFGEQAVLFGGLPPLIRAAFETLVEGGYSPDIAYFKCVQQVKLVADLIARVGIAGMSAYISNTAEYGGYVAEKHIITDDTKKEMKHLLADIQTGKFAQAWMLENKTGKINFKASRRLSATHPLEPVGEKLRAMLNKTEGGNS